MANIKSAKKRAKQNVARKNINLGRKTAIKTAIKKVISALEGGQVEQAQLLLRDAEAKMARAATKNVLHKNTALRKTSRLAKKVAAAQRVVAK